MAKNRGGPPTLVGFLWWFRALVGFPGTSGMGLVCSWSVLMAVLRRFPLIPMMGFGTCVEFVDWVLEISLFPKELVKITWSM